MFHKEICFVRKFVLSKSLFHQKRCFVEKFVSSSKSLFLRKVYFIEKFLSLLKVSFVEKFVLSKNLLFRKKLFWSIFVKWSFFMFFWQEPMQIFTLKSNTLEFQRSDENQVSYCHFSSFKAPSITEPRTKCARCETPLIQHFFKNFWSSFNVEFSLNLNSRSVRISKIRLTILRGLFSIYIVFVHT